VAIIGSGMGGSGTAYFLREKMGMNVEIVVFEKAAEAGGRTRTIEFAGLTLDAGAAAISSANAYLNEIVQKFNLSQPEGKGVLRQTARKLQGMSADGARAITPAAQINSVASDKFGIWNGTDFVFQSGTGMWELLPRLLLRYGMSVVRAKLLVQSAVSRLSQIYALQKAGVYFDSPQTMYEELGLWLVSQQTG
jgi:hypothetical protein